MQSTQDMIFKCWSEKKKLNYSYLNIYYMYYISDFFFFFLHIATYLLGITQ